ncbi:MAG TPA: V-type ATPase 116kDa subunit family protein [Spirochaetota bacterium]|nr:V-type ATPase 116kDa subunit family protein [Spirochaetota bacterium]HOS56104.1 V-type ATPase 116kDa subunit family protein [Spirochaetota bacterium]HPK61939.1 V-type ATPase 116kDa subunit family protein [Spirochaetota bacterium]HQF76807.1 V-type ATPase 116kDa subunit family protein [Spirochaetota bacterium]HQH30899.1 V-type ATPase 116kDa subunit family protein [Spirochaetota bacterium]
MIEKMKKLYLLIYHQSKDEFLERLQKIGVVHLDTGDNIQSDAIQDIKNRLSKLDKCKKIVLSNKTKNSKIAQKSRDGGDIEQYLSEIENIENRLGAEKSRLDNIRKEIELLTKWGDFDPDTIRAIEERSGYKLKLFYARDKDYDDIVSGISNDVFVEKIIEEKSKVFFAVFYKNPASLESVRASEEKIPLKSLKRLKKEAARIEESIGVLEKSKSSYAELMDEFDKYRVDLEDSLQYNVVDSSLSPEVEGKALFIRGWVPKRVLKFVEEFLEKEDVAYIVDDPAEGDEIPIKLRNNAFNRLFEPITKMHSMPNYGEMDPTPFFAPFFAAFFGLCLGDAGYGLVLFITVIVAILFGKNKKIRPILYLGFFLSLSTIIAGAVLDSFFGFKITEMTLLPKALKKTAIFTDMNTQMSFAIMLGVIQILFGYFLQTISKIKFGGIKAGLQPLGVFLLIAGTVILGVGYGLKGDFSIGPMPIKKIITSIPHGFNVGVSLIIAGVALILLFNNIDKKIFVRPFLGLWEMYGIVTGIPGDVLSYIRLFALGLAGGLLGGAFNMIAFMVRDSAPIGINYIGMIAILLAGHIINISLSALSAFVHPLRLILLEFYKAYGFVGGGKAYDPFRKGAA